MGESSIDLLKRNKNVENSTEKNDKKLEMTSAVTKDPVKSKKDIQSEIIADESNKIKLVAEDSETVVEEFEINTDAVKSKKDIQSESIANETIKIKLVAEDSETVGDDLEINTEVPIHSDDGKNEVDQLQTLEKDDVITSSEQIEESSANLVAITKERNITLNDITRNKKPSETELSKALPSKTDIKRKNKAENLKETSIYSKIEEKTRKLNSNRDKIDKLTSENKTVKKVKSESTRGKKSLIEEKDNYDIDNKVSTKQDVEIKEDSKKPEYGRQMSLG